jgi:hypothetical protein
LLLRLRLIDRPQDSSSLVKMDVTPQPKIHDEKSTKRFEESTELRDVKPAALENADYTGAEAKTDPAEIALVRKIDWRLMVRVE